MLKPRKEERKITVERTGVITYYAVTLNDIQYSVVDMYTGNVDCSERTIVELETQKEPIKEIKNRISRAIEDFETHSEYMFLQANPQLQNSGQFISTGL